MAKLDMYLAQMVDNEASDFHLSAGLRGIEPDRELVCPLPQAEVELHANVVRETTNAKESKETARAPRAQRLEEPGGLGSLASPAPGRTGPERG